MNRKKFIFFKKNLLCQAINEHIAKPHARVYNGISLFTTFLYLLSPKQQKSSCLQHQLRAAVTHRVAYSAQSSESARGENGI